MHQEDTPPKKNQIEEIAFAMFTKFKITDLTSKIPRKQRRKIAEINFDLSFYSPNLLFSSLESLKGTLMQI